MSNKNIDSYHTNWLLGFSLMFSATIPQFGMNMVAPALPQMGSYFHAQASALQYIITIYLVGYAIAVLFSGILSQRFGARRVHIWGILIFSISSIACTFVTSFHALLALRFIQALCGCGITVLSRLIVQQIYPLHKHIGIVTILALAVALSPSVAPVLGGLMLELTNWQWIFWFFSAMGILSLVLFYICVPSVKMEKETKFKLSDFMEAFCSGAKKQAFRRYLLAISLISMGQFAFLANSAYLMQIKMGISASQYGVLLAAIAIGFVIGTQGTRLTVPKYGLHKVLFIGTLLALLSGLTIIPACFLWPNSAWSLVVPMFIVMLSMGIVVPSTQAGLLRIPSEKSGYLASLFFFGQIALSTLYSMGIKSFNTDTFSLSLVIATPCLLLGVLSIYWNFTWTKV